MPSSFFIFPACVRFGLSWCSNRFFLRPGSLYSGRDRQPFPAHRGATTTAVVPRPVHPGRTPVAEAKTPSPRAAANTASDRAAC
ncbi:hypothetical protein DF048_09300 [Burkholderia seminalis]|nr:hypothetical protein DF048_09300 [Burkholderia seminalis]